MASSISTPEFFPFMLQNKDSILIIEDAENIIKSNLLNLSDGPLGVDINIHVLIKSLYNKSIF